MKKISVIIPFYNAEKYIDRCMSSLEAQSFPMEDMEILAVDDNSLDRSLERMSEWEKKYPDSIALIPLDTRVMQGAARNIAISYATGDYIMFLDADDWLLPMALSHIYEKAVKSGADITAYYSRNATEYSETDLEYETGRKSYLLKLSSTEDYVKLMFTGLTMRGCWDKMYKRDFVQKLSLRFAEGVFDEESLFTIPAFLSARRYYVLNEELHRYFENHESTVYSLSKEMEHRDDNAKTWLMLYDHLKEGGYLNRDGIVAEALFIQNYFNRSFLINIPRGLKYDAAAVKNMQDAVRMRFPDYEKNPVLMQMRSLAYTKRLMEYPVNALNMAGFEDIIREFAANVGNEL